MITTQTPLMSMAEFVEAYNETPFEYVDGEHIPIMAAHITRSGRTGGRLFLELSNHVIDKNLGEVFTEVPFVLVYDASTWVKGSRTPDIMCYSSERLKAIIENDTEWEDKPLVGAPDFVAEIISPTDKYVEVTEKIKGYVKDGVRLVWLIEPKSKTVKVFTPDNQETTLSDDEAVLTGGEVIAGFSIKLKDLFAK